MPDLTQLPTWVADSFRHLPVVVVIAAVGWAVFWYIRRHHKDHILGLERQFRGHLQSKDEEISRLTKAHTAELKRLTAAKDAQNRQLAEQVRDLRAERDELLARLPPRE